MTELDTAIAAAFSDPSNLDKTNRVYQVFLRSLFFVPIETVDNTVVTLDEEQPFMPLIADYDTNFFMLAFDNKERLRHWAGNQFDTISSVEISGRDIVDSIGNDVYLCVNVGTAYYKEFSPDELKRLKTVVQKTKRMAERK